MEPSPAPSPPPPRREQRIMADGSRPGGGRSAGPLRRQPAAALGAAGRARPRGGRTRTGARGGRSPAARDALRRCRAPAALPCSPPPAGPGRGPAARQPRAAAASRRAPSAARLEPGPPAGGPRAGTRRLRAEPGAPAVFLTRSEPEPGRGGQPSLGNRRCQLPAAPGAARPVGSDLCPSLNRKCQRRRLPTPRRLTRRRCRSCGPFPPCSLG